MTILPEWLALMGRYLTSKTFWERSGVAIIGIGLMLTGIAIVLRKPVVTTAKTVSKVVM